jgi:hypothetical protein
MGKMEKAFITLSSFVPLPFFHLQVSGKDRTSPASLHFSAPAFLNLPPAVGTADKPAKMSGLKLPGRTVFPPGGRASLNLPARAGSFAAARFHGRQEKNLPFDVCGDLAPSLLEALHGPDGGSQELSHLFLGFLHALAEGREFIGVHKEPLSAQNGSFEFFFLTAYITLCYWRKHFFQVSFRLPKSSQKIF